MSSVMENKSDYMQDVFYFDPSEMTIAPQDPPKEVRVWALPKEARFYKDELIVMVKHNPLPLLLNLKVFFK